MLPCSLHYLNLIWGLKFFIIDIVDTILFFKMSSATPQALQVFTQALHIIPQSVWCELHYKKPSQCQYQRPSWQTGPLLLLWSESLPQTPWHKDTIWSTVLMCWVPTFQFWWWIQGERCPFSDLQHVQYEAYLPLTLIRVRKQSVGGDTSGCGLVVRVHRTLKTEDVMLVSRCLPTLWFKVEQY